MSAERLLLSEKYKAFLRCDAPVEFLEGTTAAGKTTVGLFKFMLKVAESSKKLHILAADDTGAAEKNRAPENGSRDGAMTSRGLQKSGRRCARIWTVDAAIHRL